MILTMSPIHTAPTQGTVVMTDVGLAVFDGDYWCSCDHKGNIFSCEVGGYYNCRPSMWMPIPEYSTTEIEHTRVWVNFTQSLDKLHGIQASLADAINGLQDLNFTTDGNARRATIVTNMLITSGMDLVNLRQSLETQRKNCEKVTANE